MSFHQLSLIADGPTPGRTRRGGVQRTSVLAAMQERGRLDKRVRNVCHWLVSYGIDRPMPPTSLELSRWFCRPVLEVRIGLSDAKRKGLVENGEKRPCSVSGKLALTWRTKGR